MKGFAPLFLGIIGTFVFSWAGLAWIPNLQIGHLDPQTDDEGADRYPWPRSGMAERGRQVYAANGCVYCHTQQVRPDYDASDIDRKWGDRRSAPRDYLFDRPTLLGKMRMGPDLANVGHRAPSEDANAAASPPAGAAGASPAPGGSPPPPTAAAANAPAPGGSPPAPSPAAGAASSPAGGSSAASAVAGQNPPPNAPAAGPGNSASPAASPASSTEVTTGPNGEPLPYTAAWHHKHLYSPRSIALDSIMPAYRFLYDKRRVEGQIATDALKLTGDDAPPQGYEIVPSYDAKCLVAYLMSLDQSHPLKEVKSAAPAAPAKGAK
ncbi:MAG: cbb3-type cytochrome c oxidase subunit II [Chthoniobacterales bacterium]